MASSAPEAAVGEQALEVAVLEDQDQDPEHRAQAERVHHHRLDRQHHGAGHQEQDDQSGGDDHGEHRRQVRGEAVLEIHVRRGLARHAEVVRDVERADIVHELLGGVGQRSPDRGDGDQRHGPAGGLGRTHRGHVGREARRVVRAWMDGELAGSPTTRSSGEVLFGGKSRFRMSLTWRADTALGSTRASTEMNLTWVKNGIPSAIRRRR